MADRPEPDAEPAAAAQSADPSAFENLASAIGTRNLMIIIVTMPLIFLAAIAVIISVFGDDEGEAPDPPAALAAPAPSTAAPAGQGGAAVVTARANGALALPDGAEIGAMSLDGDRLALRVVGPDGETLIIYDLGAARIVHRVRVTRGDAP